MMRNFLLCLLILWTVACQQPGKTQPPAKESAPTLLVASWNLKDMGGSKDDREIAAMAEALKRFHVVAVQEITTNPAGAQALARLAEALNRSGSKWDYRLSDPTSSSTRGQERYAVLWQPSVLKLLGRPSLAQPFADVMEREPMLAKFGWGNRQLTLVNYHAIPAAKQPETEIKFLRQLAETYTQDSLLFLGDFNLSQRHSVFGPLKTMGYEPALVNVKTSLRQRCLADGCLANDLDNLFVNRKQWKVEASGVVHFFEQQPDFEAARGVSDHCPVWVALR